MVRPCCRMRPSVRVPHLAADDPSHLQAPLARQLLDALQPRLELGTVHALKGAKRQERALAGERPLPLASGTPPRGANVPSHVQCTHAGKHALTASRQAPRSMSPAMPQRQSRKAIRRAMVVLSVGVRGWALRVSA